MENQVISALIAQQAKAEEIILALVEAGFNPNQISILSSKNEPVHQNRPIRRTNAAARNWRTEERIAGYRPDDKSAKYYPQKIFAFEKQTKASEGATAGITTGSIVGGALGLLAGFGALAIPGTSPLIAAGPLMAALSGMGVGGTLGSIVGALIGVGIPVKEAVNYEHRLKEGSILLSIQTDSAAHAQEIIGILQQHSAADVTVTKDASFSQSFR